MKYQYILFCTISWLFTASCDLMQGGDAVEEQELQTTQPYIASIVKKTVATGSIQPREEIEIKPYVSGVLDKLYVEAGDEVKKGQQIARIKVIASSESLNQASSELERAKIEKEEAFKELNRQRELFEKGIIAEATFNPFLHQYNLSVQEFERSKERYSIIKDGISSKNSIASNIVRSTVDGMILDVPAEIGDNVKEGIMLDGTTIASVADMNDLLFIGFLDESEVGKVNEGMPIQLTVGAMDNYTFDAVLEYISPKGTDETGTIQFEIRAAINLPDSINLRAGYSANANVVLDKRDSVLAINEADLLFEKSKTLVEIVDGEAVSKREVKLGLSDGIQVEILEGLLKDESIKVQ